MTIRVQIPVYSDRWMRGDRYGVLIKTTRKKVQHRGVLVLRDIATVKLDISGKVRKFLLDDCQWVSQ